MNQIYDVIIIGAGASGIFAATQIKKDKSVLVIDANEKKLRKVFVSGGGRCNFTNVNASSNYYTSNNPKFCISALKSFTPNDFMEILDKKEVKYFEKQMGQMFCNSSLDVIKTLEDNLNENVSFHMKNKVMFILKKEDAFLVRTSQGLFTSKNVIVASGGKSFESLKASDIGYKIAKSFDIPIIEPRPALVGLESEEFTSLSGLSLPVKIRVNKREINDDLLFTHKGLSGPAILKASLFASNKIIINFCPTINIEEFLQSAKNKNPKMKINNILADILPKKFVDSFIEEFNISSEIANISNKIISKIASKINSYEFNITETMGYDKAEVTKGGVDTSYISSKTMETKNVPNLYFIGEVLDVTGYLGGYNLQWAWSSAFACAKDINEK